MEGQVDIEQGKRKAAALRKESRKKIRVTSDVEVTADGLAELSKVHHDPRTLKQRQAQKVKDEERGYRNVKRENVIAKELLLNVDFSYKYHLRCIRRELGFSFDRICHLRQQAEKELTRVPAKNISSVDIPRLVLPPDAMESDPATFLARVQATDPNRCLSLRIDGVKQHALEGRPSNHRKGEKILEDFLKFLQENRDKEIDVNGEERFVLKPRWRYWALTDAPKAFRGDLANAQFCFLESFNAMQVGAGQDTISKATMFRWLKSFMPTSMQTMRSYQRVAARQVLLAGGTVVQLLGGPGLRDGEGHGHDGVDEHDAVHEAAMLAEEARAVVGSEYEHAMAAHDAASLTSALAGKE